MEGDNINSLKLQFDGGTLGAAFHHKKCSFCERQSASSQGVLRTPTREKPLLPINNSHLKVQNENSRMGQQRGENMELGTDVIKWQLA